MKYLGSAIVVLTAGIGLLADPSHAQSNTTTPEQLDFFRGQIYPLLEKNCFECHGNGEKLKGGLYLTSHEAMVTGGDSGSVLALESLEKSLILEMISYEDEFTEMPPDGKLAQEDIDVLTQWVMMGAPWDPALERVVELESAGMVIDDAAKNFWSYKPVRKIEIPKVGDPEWQDNPIDALIFNRLKENGLTPAPEADKRTLIRRAYYDLTGLPPSVEQVRAFENDTASDAYEKMVDELLASPHYGEKWGRHWLDLVRYADSHGYERDSDKPYIWRYRDYVIGAFNNDVPYDQFVREQLAGDEMENAGPEQITATGYYRLGLWDDEPADPLQATFDNLDDIVSTTSQAFLGMTIGCARCHDHKLDPIPQKDYYRFLAFFRNLTETKRTPDNGILRNIMSAEEQSIHDVKVAMRDQREAELVETLYSITEAFKANAAKDGPDWLRAKDSRLSDITDLSYRFYRDTWETLPDFDMIKAETEGDLSHNYITVSPASRSAAIGFVFEGKLRVPEKGEYTFMLGATDGLRIIIGKQVVFESADLGTVNTSIVETLKEGLHPIRVEYFTKSGPPKLSIAWKSESINTRPLSIAGIDNANEKDINKLIDEHGEKYLTNEELRSFTDTRRELERVRSKTFTGKWAAAAAEQGITPPDTHLLIRGSAHAPGDVVEPAFPQVLSPPEAVVPKPSREKMTTYRRTVLADWIASPENPMTARVMVNRIWQHHFGRGIVRSTSDFGSLGDRPTHPDLLDWLATEFVHADDWHMKSLHKKIMMSKTYRMSSQGNAKALAQDPTNDLFWRYDMRRLTAEEVRDSILHATGELNLSLGGPTVYPDLPPEVIETSSKKGELVSSGMWGESSIEEQNRRSIYIHLKRSLLHPMLADFDFADFDASCPVRFTTTQASQALNLLNSDYVNDRARTLRARIEQEVGAEQDKQILRAFELAIGRAPSAQEVTMSQDFLQEMSTREGTDPARAMERYCLLVLNLNEFMFID